MERISAESDRPITDRLEPIVAGWERVLESQGLTLADAGGVGLALPFLVDHKGRHVLGDFDKFPGHSQVDFPAWAKTRLDLPLVMENDSRMALLGEWKFGAAQGQSDIVMLSFGTGIGCAVVCNGKMLAGTRNQAATLFGHTSVSLDRPVGRCGNAGCAEDLASTATLPQRVKSEPGLNGSPLAGCESLDFEQLFQFAQDGDAISQKLVEESLDVWSVLALNAVIAYDPAMLVLGGGVLRRKDLVIPAIQGHLRKPVAGVPHDVPVVAGSLEDRAALYGCACHFLDKATRE